MFLIGCVTAAIDFVVCYGVTPYTYLWSLSSNFLRFYQNSFPAPLDNFFRLIQGLGVQI